jgi:hypothetical protein
MDDQLPASPDENTLVIPTGWRRRLHPRRGGVPGPRIKVNDAAGELLPAPQEGGRADADPRGAAVVAADVIGRSNVHTSELHERFVDGWTAAHGLAFAAGDVEATLPGGGGLEGASCTCAATGVCRHQIGLILAYQRQAAQAEPVQATAAAPPAAATAPAPPAEAIGVAPEVSAALPHVDVTSPAGAEDRRGAATAPGGHFSPPDWSPGAFDDDALTGVLGERAVAAARRAHRAGYSARIHRPTAADPVASVELPTCTVRFLVPGELGYVHTDAVTAIRGEVIALAVWSFRAADEQGAFDKDVRIDVGGGSGRATAGSGLGAALSIVDQVLLDAALLTGLGAALGGDDPGRMTDAWVDARLRLLTTAELR